MQMCNEECGQSTEGLLQAGTVGAGRLVAGGFDGIWVGAAASSR